MAPIIRSDPQFVSFTGTSFSKVTNAGFTQEEFKSQAGKPDPDARLNPLPKAGVVDKIFPNPNKTSDRQRLLAPANPMESQAATQEEVRLTHFFIRSALKRTRGKLNDMMRKGFSSRRERLGDRAKQMDASFQRLDKMAEQLEFFDELAQGVLNRVLANQKG
jgi:hypothetical protein